MIALLKILIHLISPYIFYSLISSIFLYSKRIKNVFESYYSYGQQKTKSKFTIWIAKISTESYALGNHKQKKSERKVNNLNGLLKILLTSLLQRSMSELTGNIKQSKCNNNLKLICRKHWAKWVGRIADRFYSGKHWADQWTKKISISSVKLKKWMVRY